MKYNEVKRLKTFANLLTKKFPYSLSASINYNGDYYNENIVAISYSKDENLLVVSFSINEYATESSNLYQYVDENQGVTTLVDEQEHTYSLLFDTDTAHRMYYSNNVKCFADPDDTCLSIISNDFITLGIISSKTVKFLSNLTFKDSFTQSSSAGKDLVTLLQSNLLGKIVQYETNNVKTVVLPTENYVIHTERNNENYGFDIEMYLHTIHVDDNKGKTVKISYQDFEKNNVDTLVYKVEIPCKYNNKLTLLVSPI